MLSTLVAVAAEAETHHELPMSEWGFGGVALALFALGLAALWSFRGTAQKIAGDDHDEHDVHGDTHGHAHH